MPMTHAFAKTLLPAAAMLTLAACGGQDESQEPYEAGATDVSGGELIVSTPDPNAVPVRLPETPMTPVPVDTATAVPVATGSPSPTPTATR